MKSDGCINVPGLEFRVVMQFYSIPLFKKAINHLLWPNISKLLETRLAWFQDSKHPPKDIKDP